MRNLVLGVSAAADYFELLGIERRLALEEGALQKRFYELSRQWHPDLFARKSEAEREEALEMSSRLNDAYRTLRDPILRATYLLEIEGFEIGERSSKDVPPELLEEVFELNLALEELRGGDDGARPQLENARKSFDAMLAQTGSRLEELFRAWDASRERDKLAEIRGALNRRKYILNLVREVGKELAVEPA